MDRNATSLLVYLALIVALRKESVDRNVPFDVIRPAIDVSLSARRAWIEISLNINGPLKAGVALRKESVDRNIIKLYYKEVLPWVALRKESVDRNPLLVILSPTHLKSLSARRAWIEIRIFAYGRRITRVALRKESVDRNCRSWSP